MILNARYETFALPKNVSPVHINLWKRQITTDWIQTGTEKFEYFLTVQRNCIENRKILIIDVINSPETQRLKTTLISKRWKVAR